MKHRIYGLMREYQLPMSKVIFPNKQIRPKHHLEFAKSVADLLYSGYEVRDPKPRTREFTPGY